MQKKKEKTINFRNKYFKIIIRSCDIKIVNTIIDIRGGRWYIMSMEKRDNLSDKDRLNFPKNLSRFRRASRIDEKYYRRRIRVFFILICFFSPTKVI